MPNWYIRWDIPNFGVMMVERLLQTLLAGCRVIKRPFREVWNVVGKDKRLEGEIISEAESIQGLYCQAQFVCLSVSPVSVSPSIHSLSHSLFCSFPPPWPFETMG